MSLDDAPEIEKEEPAESARDTIERVFQESLTESDPGDETDFSNETPEAQAERARDEKGRFAKKTSEAETPLETTGTQPAQRVTEDQSANAAAPITAPLSVPGELRQAWNKLPREWQDYYAKRDLETSQKLSEQGRQVAELNEVLKEHVSDWEVRGITPAQVLKQHLAWSKQFESNPLEAMFRLGALYGVTPAHVAHHLQTSRAPQSGYPQQQQHGQNLPPQLAQALSRIEQFEAEQQQAAIQQQQAFAEAQYSAFANAADDKGNLLRPYWAEAYPLMQSMAAGLRERYPEADPQQFLEICYTAACNADPDLRKKVASDSERNRQQRERQEVEQARRRGSQVRGAPNGAAGAPKRSGSAREAIQAAYEDRYGRI